VLLLWGFARRKHLAQLLHEQLKQPAAQPASQQKSRVAFVRSHPLPIDASCCSEAAADAIRTAAAAAVAVTEDYAAASEAALEGSAGKHLQEQQFENERLQQVSMTAHKHCQC
jgi:hypothetical protein